ncbi:hypothetical protein ABD440_18315 [Chromobacterium piscinae]|uniref:hypothetical protein n=1 Tax=Chromobacterium piscinae TaxID=686831 RepID=UPI0031FBB4BC
MPPKAVRSVMLHIGESWQGDAEALSRELAGVAGVHEASVLLADRVAYLKVSQQQWDEAEVRRLIDATF